MQTIRAIAASNTCLDCAESPTNPKFIPVFIVYFKFTAIIPRSKILDPLRFEVVSTLRVTSADKMVPSSRKDSIKYLTIRVHAKLFAVDECLSIQHHDASQIVKRVSFILPELEL